MEPREIELMHRVEAEHWWFVGKRRALAELIKGLRLRPHTRALDLGCGTGANLQMLARRFEAIGLEYDPLALAKAQEKNKGLIRGDANQIPLVDDSLDLVTALDILYHRNLHAQTVMAEVFRVLKPGGWFLIFDAAYPSLLGPHDASMHGNQRFTRPGLAILLEKAGFSVARAFYRNTFIAPAVIPLRMVERVLWRKKGDGGQPPRSDVQSAHPLVNRIMSQLMTWEAKLVRRRNLPFGVTVGALARKTD